MSDEEQPNIKFVRLNNGDDIISEVMEIEDDKGILYTLFRPLKVVYVPAEREGYVAIAFTPWVFSSLCDNHEFFIHAEDVLIVTDASEKMNTYYWNSVDQHYGKEPIKEDISEKEEIERMVEFFKQLELKRTFH